MNLSQYFATAEWGAVFVIAYIAAVALVKTLRKRSAMRTDNISTVSVAEHIKNTTPAIRRKKWL